MDDRLIETYKGFMEQLLKENSERLVPEMIDELENLDDDTLKIEKEFESNRSNIGLTFHWISIFRIVKMSMNMKKALLQRYDAFVSTYQKLSGIQRPSEDQKHLLSEVGELLYNVDDLLGQHDRLITKLMGSMRQGMLEDYGINMEPDNEFFRSIMNPDTSRKIHPILRDIYSICDRILEQLRIMNALERVRRLMTQ